MAKKQSTLAAAEDKLEEFADDLGKLLGDAKSKAEGWIGQRKRIAEYLTGLQDTAAGLLAQLGVGAAPTGRRKPGRPRKAVASAAQSPRKRTMSPEARARISAAQKRRWAKVKRQQQ